MNLGQQNGVGDSSRAQLLGYCLIMIVKIPFLFLYGQKSFSHYIIRKTILRLNGFFKNYETTPPACE